MGIRDDALAIWQAGVAAVDSDTLVQENVACDGRTLRICDTNISLADVKRIEVVGGGKAGAGMTRGLLAALGQVPDSISVDGWINVPEDCVEKTDHIHLHAARPAGVNEPTAAGVDGTREILRRVGRLRPDDLCIVLISGGGSALLPAPLPDVSLADKVAVTRVLATAGAPIHELNIVRSQLSVIKGGGLLRQCTSYRMVALIISDVIGDPVDIIASGPTVPSGRTAADALAVLRQYDPDRTRVPPTVYRAIECNAAQPPATDACCSAVHHIIGSNGVALMAARTEAMRRHYNVVSLGSENCGEARVHGVTLLSQLSSIRSAPDEDARVCVLAGGETTVTLTAADTDVRGGRNQEVVLGAIAHATDASCWKNIVLLSGGTDGEDGPTDAAGAFADEALVANMKRQGMSPSPFLSINNSYPFFQQLNGLLHTGPTHTNVMDLAVGIVVQVAD
jgi:glycerate 2-kinase